MTKSFIQATVTSYSEDGISQHSFLLPAFTTFLPVPLKHSLGLGRDNIDVPFKAEYSTVTYSHLLDQLRVFALTVA